MNITATTREALTEVARDILVREGASSVSIRAVAARGGVSVGCVYNYFTDKADLLAAAVTRVWREVFRLPEASDGFTDCVRQMLAHARGGTANHPAFLAAHTAGFAAGEKDEGRKVMNAYFGSLRDGLLNVLRADPRVRADAFDNTFTPEAFVSFVLSSMVATLARSPEGDATLAAVVDRVIAGGAAKP